MLMRLRREEGNVLVTTVLVSMIVGMLAALVLETGRQAEFSSASDRNHDIALGVAEAGVHQTVASISSQVLAGGSIASSDPAPVTTPQGTYDTVIHRCLPPIASSDQSACSAMSVADGYVIESRGWTPGTHLDRARRIRVSLEPPLLYSDGGEYALFSYTSIDLKNNDHVYAGNVWANDSVNVDQNVTLNGSVTAAQSWITTGNGSNVTGNLISGGYNAASHYAQSISGVVGGFARASVTAPSDPESCVGEPASEYKIILGQVAGDVSTLGTVQGTNAGSIHTGVCTAAPAAKPLAPFTYNPNNYDPSSRHEFASVAAFNAWKAANPGGGKHGTFHIAVDPTASQSNRVDLSGWDMDGDLTVVAENAPIYTGSITDNGVVAANKKVALVLVSHYQPPTSTGCDVNHDDSDCSVHAKNFFQASCNTVTLAYADKGPVAVKNNSYFCGSVMSNGILIKNNQDLNYDALVKRVIGFGPNAFEIKRWEELHPS